MLFPAIHLPTISAFVRRLGLRIIFFVSILAAVPTFAATTTTLTITSGEQSTSVTTVPSASAITLTATVVSGSGAVTAGHVNFCDATALYCTDIHILGTAQLTVAGTATLKLIPGIGSHSYKAVFVQTNSNPGSSSSTSVLTVTGIYPTRTTIAQSGSAGNYTLTATVSGAGENAPTGTISFLDTSDGNYVLGETALGTGQQTLSFATTSTSFPGTPSSATSAPPNGVADFNGDGKLDIVAISPAGNQLTLMLGNGDGTFTAGPTPSISFLPGGIAVGDFNGDGKQDIAVSSSTSSLATVLFGNGDGTFTQAPSTSTVSINSKIGSIFAGDVNGDGKLDLIVFGALTQKQEQGDVEGGQTYLYLTVALGNGNGSFTIASSTRTYGAAFGAVADFNGDGRTDLVYAEPYNGFVDLMLGNEDGTFTFSNLQSQFVPATLAVGDLNGDGNLDIVQISSGPNPSYYVLFGNGSGNFSGGNNLWSFAPSGLLPSSVAVGDFNNDGHPDLAVFSVRNEAMVVLLGNGAGSLTEPSFTTVTNPVGNTSQSPVIGDFNGDGLPDVATTNLKSNSLEVSLTHSVLSTATVKNIAVTGTGTHQVEASYAGDSSHSTSVSGTIGLTAHR